MGSIRWTLVSDLTFLKYAHSHAPSLFAQIITIGLSRKIANLPDVSIPSTYRGLSSGGIASVPFYHNRPWC